jgi:uncharacterized membrane protein
MSNPLKLTIKSEIFSWLLVAASIAASFYFYAHFPNRVVTHWDFAGQPNGWSNRAFAAFFFPGLLLAIYLVLAFIPRLDPKKERYAEFAKTYDIFRNFILLVMTIIYFITSLVNIGFNLNVGSWVSFIIGLLFIILGNYFGKLKRNWFIGIRTPWTMSSESVWNKTHRFGGKAFILAGLLMILTGFSPMAWRLPLFVAAIIILLVGTIAYSYLAYRQENKK